MIGQKLAQYEIRQRLGAGAMGEVYRAYDTQLGREVALKLLPPELAAKRRRIERFRREARALASLSHPSIVTVHSVEEVDGKHLLTMELIEGTTLDELIGSKDLGLARLFEIAVPLADALAAAHAGGVIHRDLKPSNVMLTKSGQVKVLDFGLAKLDPQHRESFDSQLATEALTVEGHILGTVPYMAPEQLRGEPADERSDIFALGVVLYELATGERPFRGGTSAELVASILRETPLAVDERKAEIPHHLARIIRHCLEKDPERRFQSAKDVRNALDDLKWELTTAERGTRPGSSAAYRLPPRKKLPYALPLAGVLALALAALMFWSRDSGPRDPSVRHPVGTEVRALLDQGHLFELRGPTRENLEAAEDRYRRALRLEPENPVVQARLAAHLAAMQIHQPEPERSAEAAELADRALAAEPELVDARIARGNLALLEQDLAAARQAASRAIETAPGDYRGHTLLGEILMAENREDEGLQRLRRATELAGTDTRARLTLAYHLWESGRTDEAAVVYQEVLDYHPDSPSALNNLGMIYGQQGRYLDAIPLLKRLLQIAGDVDAAINLAVCYFYLDRMEDAVVAYRRALDIEPGHPWAQHGLAEAYERLGDQEQARHWFESAIAAYDERLAAGEARPRILGLRAVCAAKLGRFEEALANIDEALGADPDRGVVHFNAAQVQALAGRREAMIESAKRAIESGYARQEFESDLSFRAYLDDPEFRAVLESTFGP